jgi:FSR family fosmidomycin resistance protein-like MFS transporter
MSTETNSGKIHEAVPWASVSILFFVHFVVDSHAQFFAPLIPLLQEKFHFSLTTAGFLISMQSLTSAATQPVTALIIDRWPWIPWLAVGIVGSSIAFTAIGWVPIFAGVAASIVLGGMLFGLSHPDMAARAGRLSEQHNSLCVSIFVTGGRLGFAFGPLVVIAIATNLGLEWLWIYVLVALTAMALVVWGLPSVPRPKKDEKGAPQGANLKDAIRRVRWPISLLFGVAIVRSITMANLGGFLPKLFVDMGQGLWLGGLASTVLFVSGAAGVMTGGFLGDRLGKRFIIIIGSAIALIGMLGFIIFPIAFAYFSLATIGFGAFIPMGVSVALAQEYLPNNRGFASSLMLGGGWLVAAFTSVPIAAAAERIGLLRAFWVLPVFMCFALLFAFLLPTDEQKE